MSKNEFLDKFKGLIDIERVQGNPSNTEVHEEYVSFGRYNFKRRTYCPFCRGRLSSVEANRSHSNITLVGVCRRCTLLVNITVMSVGESIDLPSKLSLLGGGCAHHSG